MYKKLLETFFFVIFIALNCSAEVDIKHYDDQKIYDLAGLFAKTARDFQNAMRLKTLKPLDDLQLRGIDEDFKFKPLNFELRIQLQNVSKCMQDIYYTVENIRSEWGLKLIDSYGKPESGILNGNFRWIGDYNECVGIRVSNPDSNSTAGHFRGKYCSLTWSLKSLNLTLPFSFVSGVCIPDSCSAGQLQQDALQLLQMAGVLPALNDSNSILNSDALQCKPTERHLNAAAKAIIALLSAFCALAVIGSSITAVKYFKKILKECKTPSDACDINDLVKVDPNNIHAVADDEALLQDDETVAIKDSVLKEVETFLTCFCMFTNGAKLLNTNTSEGELLCVHGIRFLSMSWVILGHSYVFGYTQMKNMVKVLSVLDTFPFQAVLQAFFSVDSFFVLSGFLLTFLSMKEFSRTKGRISWPYFYIHRYLRLTPMYMVLLGFAATVYLYLGSGPYWPNGDYDVACKKVWWRNLLYINNFDLEAGQCLSWSWYLANDMQFFIISPLFLITLWRWPIIGYVLIQIFLMASCLSNFFITYHFDLGNGVVTFFNSGVTDIAGILVKFTEYFDKLYVKPYARIGPYLVGILAGFTFFKRKASNAPKHSLVVGILAGYTFFKMKASNAPKHSLVVGILAGFTFFKMKASNAPKHSLVVGVLAGFTFFKMKASNAPKHSLVVGILAGYTFFKRKASNAPKHSLVVGILAGFTFFKMKASNAPKHSLVVGILAGFTFFKMKASNAPKHSLVVGILAGFTFFKMKASNAPKHSLVVGILAGYTFFKRKASNAPKHSLVMGILAGYTFFKRKASNAPKHSLVFLTIGWIVASSVTLVTVYGLYHTHPNLIARSFYNALSRVCWAAGLSWVIYVCLMGQGGFINSLLSFKLFIPLSRLTYAAYLIHPLVISGYFLNLKTSLEFSHPTVVTLFLGFMLVTYALSLPVSLILESPIVALEKLIRKKLTTEKKIEAVN